VSGVSTRAPFHALSAAVYIVETVVLLIDDHDAVDA
jgi:hypothetical protein